MHFNTKLVPVILLLLFIFSLPVAADDFFLGEPSSSSETLTACEASEEECPAVWESSVEFGYVAVTGNKDTDSLNGRFSLSYEKNKWHHQGFIAIVTSSSEETVNNVQVKTDAEKYTAQAKSDFKLSRKSYAFGILDYDDTKDSGFEYQSSIATGVGYTFIKDKEHSLETEVGVGSRTSKTEATALLSSESSSENITRVAARYKWKINTQSTFEQKLSTEIGDDNTITKSYSGLSANIVENLALKLSYSFKEQSDVPINNEKRETITAFTVVYSF
jgi:putative salt-induced outer membrane protein